MDASVALKWVMDEPGSEQAETLLADLAGGAVSLAAPEHLLGEVGNGLRKRVAQKVLTADDALYVLLALDLDAELVTADLRLADAVADRALPVRSLSG
ncbi:MAG: type II toxin-antitoxin system VapC family toxin [Nocardioidaceae bacterium]